VATLFVFRLCGMTVVERGVVTDDLSAGGPQPGLHPSSRRLSPGLTAGVPFAA
jgi:hypothetical protein